MYTRCVDDLSLPVSRIYSCQAVIAYSYLQNDSKVKLSVAQQRRQRYQSPMLESRRPKLSEYSARQVVTFVTRLRIRHPKYNKTNAERIYPIAGLSISKTVLIGLVTRCQSTSASRSGQDGTIICSSYRYSW